MKWWIYTGTIVAIVLGMLGVRYNWTDSVPHGWWWQHQGPIRRWSFVIVCLPAPIAAEGLYEHYLSPGVCPGTGAMPVVKVVAGLPGDRVVLGADGSLAIDGVAVAPCGRRLGVGSNGARIRTFVSPGTFNLGRAELWLCGVTEDAWDSRYYGPVPAAGVRGLATPLATGGPGWPVYNSWRSLLAGRE